ncbi:MAG: LPS assembly protein LptD [Neisseriaceae bacterium]
MALLTACVMAAVGAKQVEATEGKIHGLPRGRIGQKAQAVKRHLNCCHSSKFFHPIDPVRMSGAEIPGDGGLRLSAEGKVEGVGEEQIKLEKNVIAEQEGQILNSNYLIYLNGWIRSGPFTLKRGTQLLSGNTLHYNVKDRLGTVEDFHFIHEGKRFPLQAEGKKLRMLSEDSYQLQEAKLNTCEAGDDSWYLKTKEVQLDYARNIGIAKQTQLVFFGVPLFMVPWFDFPLNGNRKSGFLSPMIGLKSSTGLGIAVPYYFNLAPNYDATLTPHFYSKRGLAVEGEFRYLFPHFSGKLLGQFLARDRAAEEKDRYLLSMRHLQQLTPKLSLGIDYSRVSDEHYFEDFGSRVDAADNSHLNQQIWLDYRDELAGGNLHTFFTFQRHQNFHGSKGEIDEPYALEPQLNLRWFKSFQGRTELEVLTQISNFRHSTKPMGFRSFFYPSVTWNWSNEWGFLRPRLGLHASYYSLSPYKSSTSSASVYRSKQHFYRVLPIVSLDSGLIFERPLRLHQHRYVQTLEPRFFYSYIPYRNQAALPNFDSETLEPSFPSLFRENRLTGEDRIAEANDLSYSLLSRIYDLNSGKEVLVAGVGQRFALSRLHPIMDAISKQSKKERPGVGTLLFARGYLGNKFTLQTDMYFNHTPRTDSRYAVRLGYNAGENKVLNLSYRYNSENPRFSRRHRKVNQLDFSFQWPVARDYSLVGHSTYSLSDHRPLESLLGVEYTSPCHCWGVSAVFESYMTEYNKRKKAVFFQLNFRGLGGLGISPMRELYRSIPGYRSRREVRK